MKVLKDIRKKKENYKNQKSKIKKIKGVSESVVNFD